MNYKSGQCNGSVLKQSMSSKRALYVQANANTEKRRPLAQGRLVSGFTVPLPKPQVLASGIDDSLSSIHSDSRHRSDAVQDPRGFLHSTAIDGEPTVTPRKIAPSRTEHASPARSRPTDDLDLTDSDLESSQHLREGRIRQQSEVLLIDASHGKRNPNLSEIDVKVRFERTPVKIVCHSPANLNSSLRNSVSKNSPKRVQIEEPPSIAMVQQPHSKENTPPQRPAKMQESCSPIDNFPVVSQMMKDKGRLQMPEFSPTSDSGDHRRISPHLEQPIPQLDLVNSPKTRTTAMDQEADDALSVCSDTCSVNELFTTKPKKRPPQKSADKPLPVKAPGTGKKKKTTVVPSRYLAAAENKVKSSRSLLEKSSRSESKHKANRSEQILMKSQKQHPLKRVHNIRAPIGVDSRPLESRSADKQKEPSTPNQSTLSTDRKTSTPTNDGSNFPQEIDASAIHSSEISMLSNSDVPQRNSSHLQQSKTKSKKKPTEISQETLLLYYNRYLQIYYLECKARKTFLEQQKQAMAQIKWVYDEVERLRALKQEKEKELARLKNINKLEEQLSLQAQCLRPVSETIKGFSDEYSNLAQALDVTRHQIAVDDVYVPKDQEQYQNQLVSVLNESEYLLGQITSMTRQSASNVASTANALQAEDMTLDKICDTLQRCGVDIGKAEKLIIQEMALRGQELQDAARENR